MVVFQIIWQWFGFDFTRWCVVLAVVLVLNLLDRIQTSFFFLQFYFVHSECTRPSIYSEVTKLKSTIPIYPAPHAFFRSTPIVMTVMRPENWTNDWWLLRNWLSVQATELNRLDLSH
jgi:hypothetical protein